MAEPLARPNAPAGVSPSRGGARRELPEGTNTWQRASDGAAGLSLPPMRGKVKRPGPGRARCCLETANMAGAGPEGPGSGARPGLPAGGAGRDGGGGSVLVSTRCRLLGGAMDPMTV